jgi:hypothetical protein
MTFSAPDMKTHISSRTGFHEYSSVFFLVAHRIKQRRIVSAAALIGDAAS